MTTSINFLITIGLLYAAWSVFKEFDRYKDEPDTQKWHLVYLGVISIGMAAAGLYFLAILIWRVFS